MAKINLDEIKNWIIHVQKEHGPILRAAGMAYRATPQGKKFQQHIKDYLDDRAVKYWIIIKGKLKEISSGHESFHEDSDGNYQHHYH